MSTHLVLGAGPVGSAIARQLAAAGGHDVRLVSRSGRGPDTPGITRVASPADDVAALEALAEGSSVVYNALNPAHYHRWQAEWPPMAHAVLAAAERSGAVLATVSNLYPYGRVDGPISEDLPDRPADDKGRVRAEMWQDALAAHRAGRVRAVEVRAGDYLGAGAYSAATMGMEAVVAGKTARVLGRPDVLHSWTYTGDVARLLIAAAADASAHGRVWHVPTNPARTQADLLAEIAAVAGVVPVPIRPTPGWLLRAMGVVARPMSAVAKVTYQFTDPFVIDDSAARAHFGLQPTPWDDVLRETVADLQQRVGAPRGSGKSARAAAGAR